MQVRKFFLKLALLAGLLFPVLFLLQQKYNTELQKDMSIRSMQIMNIKDKNFGYIVSGSSRSQSLQKKILDELTGQKGLNMGMGGSGLAENFLCLSRFYENRNTAVVLFLQIDIFGLVQPETFYPHPFGDQKYLPFINDPACDSTIAANTNPIKHVLRKYIPFFRYAEYNNIYPVYTIFSAAKPRPGKDLDVPDNDLTDRVAAWKKISHRTYYAPCRATLESIVELARKNGTEVVLYTAPVYHPYITKYEPDYRSLQDSLNVIVRSLKVEYHDFAAEPISEERRFFADNLHLSAEGILAFDSIFSSEIPACKKLSSTN